MMLADSKIIKQDKKNITLELSCPDCKASKELVVTVEAYNLYKSGELVQDAFPELSREDMDLILSGMCEMCWKIAFNETEEEAS